MEKYWNSISQSLLHSISHSLAPMFFTIQYEKFFVSSMKNYNRVFFSEFECDSCFYVLRYLNSLANGNLAEIVFDCVLIQICD